MEIHDLNIFHHGSFKVNHVHGIDIYTPVCGSAARM